MGSTTPSHTDPAHAKVAVVAPSGLQGAMCCAPLRSESLSAVDAEELARAFAALADPVRLRLFNLIAQAGEACSCDFEAPLAKSQPTISHHTKILVEAGLIVGEKRGRWMWWRIVPERVDALARALG